MHTRAPRWLSLALLMAGSGVTHLIRPAAYDPLIPRLLGRPRPWVLGSGVAELACAGALVAPVTRRAGGYACAALFVAVFPGNVQMAVTAVGSSRSSLLYRAATLARLPLQAPLIGWALRVARAAGEPSEAVGPGGITLRGWTNRSG